MAEKLQSRVPMGAGDGDRCLDDEGTITNDFADEFAANYYPLKYELVNGNGVVVTLDSGSCEGSSGAAANFRSRTYKRQKHCKKSSSDRKYQQDQNTEVGAKCQLEHQTIKESVDRDSDATVSERMDNASSVHDVAANVSCDSSRLQWHRIILEQIYQSLSDDGGVGECIQNALAPDTKTDKMKVKGFGDAFEAASKGSLDGADQWKSNQMCKNVLSDVFTSRKFTLLCKLLVENFEGTKIDRLLDFGIINSRMKKGIYEHSPTLFLADAKQVWGKLEEIGTDLVYLAKSLGDVAKDSCHEHVGISAQSSGDGNHMVNGHRDAKLEQPTEDSARIFTCKQCGCSANGRECLICDSCEEMHHLSCIQPPLEEIPPLNWYCTNCTSNGTRSSTHENCSVCEKLNDPGVGENGFVKKAMTMAMAPDNLENCCKICGSGFLREDKLRECGRSSCVNKYHDRCLSTKQLESYGPLWYCPSCLCRVCLMDRDDNQSIICDGCDYAYHIYCLKPALEEVVSDKWFCSKCELRIRAVVRAKRACEGVKKRDRKKKDEEAPEVPNRGEGGVDMLLTAAKTLRCGEENHGNV